MLTSNPLFISYLCRCPVGVYKNTVDAADIEDGMECYEFMVVMEIRHVWRKATLSIN